MQSELQATPLPPGPAGDVLCKVEGENVFILVGDRRYRVRGLAKNLGYGQLKVNLMASRGDEFHLDTLDLCVANQRQAFAKVAAGELQLEEETVRRDLKKVLAKLEELQDEQIRQALEPKAATAVKLTDQETEAALAFLKDPRLVERILEDFERCGVVGEETNKLLGYLAAVSRKLAKPLAVMIQSSSAAGKSWLMDSVLEFVPEEERVKYTALTGQSLFYMSETNLQHKVLAIAEEEGAQRASYALKTLQSDGRVSIASVGKDPTTGKLVTQEYKLEGPVMIFSTTTAIDVDEEFLNRCLVLTVDEGREQTRAIHRMQREMHTEEGIWLRKDRKTLRRLHQNAQRLLRPVAVINPWARELTFVDDKTRTRRDHEKYLALIDAIALLRQHQRAIKVSVRGGESEPALTATLEDVELANRLANQVLGRSLDELPPQTRRLLEITHRMVSDACARLQMKPAEFYIARYGAIGKVILALRLDDIFHGLPFALLTALFTSSVISSATLRWPVRLRNAGFFICHVGLLTSLGGAAASATLSIRGRIDLFAGSEHATHVRVTKAGEPTGEVAALGFDLHLNRFELVNYEPEYRVGYYEQGLVQDEHGVHQQWQIKASFDPDLEKHRLPSGDSFRLKGIYPEFRPLPNPATGTVEPGTAPKATPCRARYGRGRTVPRLTIW